MNAAAEAEFRDFVVARRTRLKRTAYLLTGDHDRAERLVRSAFVRARRRWRRAVSIEDPEVYLLRTMGQAHVAPWRRLMRRMRGTSRAEPTESPEQAGGQMPLWKSPEGEEIWRALLALPPRARLTLVLTYYEGLPEAEIAALLGRKPRAVSKDAERGLDAVRTALDRFRGADEDAAAGAAESSGSAVTRECGDAGE